MSGLGPKTEKTPAREGWNPPRPEQLPEDTYWPASLALGSTLLFWGILTSWIITAVGFALFVVSIAGWIGELRHD